MDIKAAIEFLLNLNIKSFGIDQRGIRIYKDTIITEKLEKIPYKILEVNGKFICRNIGLRTLENFPDKVDGDFDVSHNNLRTLEGGPLIVKGNYLCSNNNLISLKGAAYKVGGSFSCANNFIDGLEYLPMEIGETLNVSNNMLLNLEYAPMYISPEKFNYSKNLKLSKKEIDDYWYERISRDISIWDKIKNRVSPEGESRIRNEFLSLKMVTNFSEFKKDNPDLVNIVVKPTGEIIQIKRNLLPIANNLRIVFFDTKFNYYVCDEEDISVIKSIK